MTTSLLILGIGTLLCAITFAWTSGKEGKSFGWVAGAYVFTSAGVVFMGFWMLSLGVISSEFAFNQLNGDKSTVYVFVGDTISILNGEKTHITTLYIPGDREYVYRFKNLPPQGYKSIKTEVGQTLFVPEKYVLAQ
ncbi:MAG: hypothetical protein Q7S11_00125 [bacterium]|nr:hypothetical protein [bacterium]